MSDHLQDVAIIGAGLGGCALALALSQRNVPVRIHESRPKDAPNIPSGVVLTPNGLTIVEKLGILQRIKPFCYVTTHRTVKNAKDETTKKIKVSGKPFYEYGVHRLWRGILLDQMRQMLEERSVEIEYNAKFERIIGDTTEGVDYAVNGRSHHAAILIGMDGIHSQVRKYLAPDIVPKYMGTTGVLCHIKRASVEWPYDDYEWTCTIQDKPGAIFWIPEDPEGEDIMIGKQRAVPEYSRDELGDLQQDKDKLAAFYTEDYDEWGPTAKKIIDQVVANKHECFIWPYVKVPTLPRWYSDTGRVILCGDAAHALPPSSGQGINQALEDVYSLTLLLQHTSCGRTNGTSSNGTSTNGPLKNNLIDALGHWQAFRQKRIDAIADWAENSTNVERMSEAEREKVIAAGRAKPGDEMRWLYEPTLEADVEACLAGHS